MLKKIMFMACAMSLSSAWLQAQTSDSLSASMPKTTQTLFGNLKPKLNTIGLYVAPEFQYFGAMSSFAAARGLSAQLIFNERLSIGVAGGKAERFTPKSLNNSNLRMRYSYAGGQLEYTFAPHRVVHFSIPLLIGAGFASIDTIDGSRRGNRDWDDDDFRENRSHNPFFIVQPGLRLETNLLRFAKFYIGANYRVAVGNNGVTYPTPTASATVSNSQLSGVSFTAGVKLGFFDYKLKNKRVLTN
jgi:hypothetical protein